LHEGYEKYKQHFVRRGGHLRGLGIIEGGGHIMMDVKEIGCESVDWFQLAQGRVQGQSFVNMEDGNYTLHLIQDYFLD
jgi:hypothetical protein